MTAGIQLSLRILFQISRKFRDPSFSPESFVDHVFDDLFPKLTQKPMKDTFSDLDTWNEDSLTQALAMSEGLIAHYVIHFHNLSIIPVIYYKRERLIRRHLDQQFSLLFKEIARRTKGFPESTLILNEPIYYLMQKFRERKFPKVKNIEVTQELLKSRLHSDLSQYFGRDPFSDHSRRVLLPYEIK